MDTQKEDIVESQTDAIEGNDNHPSPEEMLKNTRAEFSRKLGNVESRLNDTTAALQAMLNQLNESRSSGSSQPAKRPTKDLLFDNPEEYAEQITQEAVRQATQVVTRQQEANNMTQAAIADVSSRYPEFAQAGSEAAALAVQKANALPKNLKGTAEGARLVMLEAAAELGLVPVSKRTQQRASSSDSEPVGGSGRSSSQQQRQVDSKKPKVDAKTLAFAELLGIDIKDPKRLEGLEKASSREFHKKYQ